MLLSVSVCAALSAVGVRDVYAVSGGAYNTEPSTRVSLPPKAAAQQGVSQADARTRTGDPFITSEVLYQLSYVGESAVDGIGRTAASRVRPPST